MNRTSPDYIFEKPGDGYIVLECKGTQSGRSASLSQLKRGTEQVTSLFFQSRTKVLTLIIGTCLSTNGTTVYVIDPPPEDYHGNEDHRRIIQDEELFRKDLEEAKIADIYQYLGVTAKAAAYTQDYERRRSLLSRGIHEPPQRRQFPELGEDYYVGLEQAINFSGDRERIRLFQGLPERLYNVLESAGKTSFEDEGRVYRESILRITDPISLPAHEGETPNIVIRDQTENTLIVSVIGHDNTMLRLEISQHQ